MARFPSKIDALFGGLLGIAVLVPVVTAVLVAAALERVTPLLLLPPLVASPVVAMMLRTSYDVTDDELTVRSGPFRWRIPLASIRRLRATRTLLSAPALSMDIDGAGHASVLLNDIESASLEATLPPMRKAWGFNSYTALRGRFVNPRLGEGRVWVRRNDPPYILARTRGGFLLLNLNDPASTRAMYTELSKRLQDR